MTEQLENKAPDLKTWWGLICHLENQKKLPWSDIKTILGKYEGTKEGVEKAYQENGLIR